MILFGLDANSVSETFSIPFLFSVFKVCLKALYAR